MADLEECMHDFRFVDAETAPRRFISMKISTLHQKAKFYVLNISRQNHRHYSQSTIKRLRLTKWRLSAR